MSRRLDFHLYERKCPKIDFFNMDRCSKIPRFNWRLSRCFQRRA